MAAKHPVKRPAKARELAERFGVSERTVRRVMAQPREQYLAESLMRNKPWEKLGMSRATWYRRGKPQPESCNGMD
ncbi:hypothetical protein Tsedi_02396 [Tepidimonas sediminis]|uniref:Uncharacterized protein n=1 Tax=Tepidimonas sediminis TaxID=2588941 RepID=A0A554WF79_9BURK|nr:HTH domain-containing protein [Tepidimonas sediminis]TSE22235.1 hypothetical protein Tsedi_02396 [Tepidimonas sediminis]